MLNKSAFLGTFFVLKNFIKIVKNCIKLLTYENYSDIILAKVKESQIFLQGGYDVKDK